MLHLNTINEKTHQLLLSLQSKDYLSEFALVGGTNLSLRFGHRTSIDLDMFSTSLFSPSEINDLLQIEYNYTYRSNNKYMLFSYINNIKVDWIHHAYSLLEPIETIDGIRFYSLADVAAMKLFAVTKRESKKDFFDLYALSQRLSSEKIIEYFRQKYGDDKFWMMKISLLYFDDADTEEDPEILEKGLTWLKVKRYMLDTFSPH